MRYNQIRSMDIADGPGVRVSLFFQGCHFHCKNCFNSDTWDFNKGLEFDDKVIDNILELCKPEYISGLSILGGEPLHPVNISGTIALAKRFKSVYPNKTIWVWTGYKYEDIFNKEVLSYIDVLVDGQYIDELHDPKLKYKGSSNQRVIDIKSTLKENKIVLFVK
ncbi:MAG: anaerobic ribonucleoside-triphosphate reductase activating protein [Acholeplasmatales bacterium]|nr:anaerobic ribonucleoside-triphosphate reductase activating protein [Acholeplasmatales bacterium]